MSTSTITKAIDCAVEKWCKAYPKQVVESYISSAQFVKQLTVLAIGAITHKRNLLPEDCFTSESFCGFKITTLKHQCNNKHGQFWVNSLMSAFEALDRKYLEKLVVCLYNGECISQNVTEYYCFEYCYQEQEVSVQMRPNSGGAADSRAVQHVRMQSVDMLKACYAMLDVNVESVAGRREIIIRLYYNSDAPKNYQAPGYSREVGCDDLLEETFAESVRAGCVETPYHQVTLRGYLRGDNASFEAIASLTMKTQQTVDTSSVASDTSAALLTCVCNGYEPRGDPPLTRLTCQYCNTQQHAVCYGVMSPATMKTPHCCVSCASADPRRRSDRRLAAGGERLRQNLPIFRRTLALCTRAPALSARWLTAQLGVSARTALRVAHSLHKNGATDSDPGADATMQVNINPEQLQLLIDEYFNDPKEDMVERLIEQSRPGPQSLPDPVGELLSQEERAELQNTLPIGRVISNPEENNNVDPTMKEYREVLIRDEEMLLSGDPVKDMQGAGRGSKRKSAGVAGTAPKSKRKTRRGGKV